MGMGIKTLEWEKSLHTVPPAEKKFFVNTHMYRLIELPSENGNGRELGIARWKKMGMGFTFQMGMGMGWE